MDGAQTAKQRSEEARQKVERLALACRMVFGVEGKRTDPQELVWQWFRAQCYEDRTTMVPDAEGTLCPLRMSQAEGQRILFLQLKELVRRASEVGEAPVKPDVTR